MLEFPTLAEQAVAMFRESKRTIAFKTIAVDRFGASVEKTTNAEGRIEWTYVFDDDTSAVCRGHGKAWKVETFYP